MSGNKNIIYNIFNNSKFDVKKLEDILYINNVKGKDVKEYKNLPVLSLTKEYGVIPQEQKFKKRVAIEDVSEYKHVSINNLVYNPYVIWEGAIHISQIQGLTSPAYEVWGIKDNIEINYLKYIISQKKFLHTIYRLSQGVVQRRRSIGINDFKQIQIPSPPLIEQRGIAEVLGTVDEFIRLADAAIEKSVELKRGLIQKLLTKGIGHTEFEQTELGEIPKTWEIIGLSETGSYKNGIYKPEEFYGKGFPSIRMHNIKGGKINSKGAPLLDVTSEELELYGLLPGDILINRVNSIDLVGKSGIVTEELGKATFESKNIRFRPLTSKVNPKFIVYQLNTNRVISQLRSYAKAAIGQATINQDDLNRVKLALPNLVEQEKITKILCEVDSKIDIQNKYKTRLIETKKGLMQVLLSGQIRVRLDEGGLHRIGDG